MSRIRFLSRFLSQCPGGTAPSQSCLSGKQWQVFIAFWSAAKAESVLPLQVNYPRAEPTEFHRVQALYRRHQS